MGVGGVTVGRASRHSVEGKRIVLRLCLYEEQATGDKIRGELGSSNLEESCFPEEVIGPKGRRERLKEGEV
jgi:hypothetical protein